jgi:hypothetical protein
MAAIYSTGFVEQTLMFNAGISFAKSFLAEISGAAKSVIGYLSDIRTRIE